MFLLPLKLMTFIEGSSSVEIVAPGALIDVFSFMRHTFSVRLCLEDSTTSSHPIFASVSPIEQQKATIENRQTILLQKTDEISLELIRV